MVALALTSLFQQYWLSIGSFTQNAWKFMQTDLFRGDEWLSTVPGLLLLSSMVYLVVNAMYMVVDFMDWPLSMVEKRIQRDRTFTWHDYWHSFKLAIFNLFITGYAINEAYYRAAKWMGVDFGPTLPSFAVFARDLLISGIFYDITYYFLHRAIHYKFLYKYIHKLHHEWTAPVSIAGYHVHPIEHFLTTFGAALGGPLLLSSHVIVGWAVVFLGMMNSLSLHSGYHSMMPLAVSPEAHDLHHSSFVSCFGAAGILDRVFGTDKLFREKEQYQYHILFLTTGIRRRPAVKQEHND